MGAGFQVRDPVADQRMAATPQLWRYLPRLLAYPLSGFCAPMIATCALLLGVALLSSAPGVLGVPATALPMVAIIGTWVLRYALSVLEQTALGHATPPPMSGEMAQIADRLTVYALVGPGLLCSLVLALERLAPAAATPALLLGLFLLPAHFLVLATQRSLEDALNPLRLLQVIVHGGLAYLLVCALIAIAALLALRTASLLSTGLALALLFYTLFFACHLLGYLAYHRHEALQLKVRVAPPSAERTRAAERETRLAGLMAAIDPLLGRRDWQAAWARIEAEPERDEDRRAWHLELLEALRERQSWPLVLTQSARLVSRLLEEKRAGQALEVLGSALDISPDFELEQADQRLPLAEQAWLTRQAREFHWLVEADPARPAALAEALERLALRWWLDVVPDEAQAARVLQGLLARPGAAADRSLQGLARVLKLAPPSA
ncbi:MAG TPA: hypothetical protein VFV27_00235 [Nevskiaceae bacterium]|nr:hypothetical protein [Nevskiaceae bacterium]